MFPSFKLSSSSLIRSLLCRSSSNVVQPVSGQMAIKSLNFQDFNEKLNKPGIIVLDVREKGELTTDGKIAGTKNIPVGEIQKAFKMDDNAFQEKYGFAKPSANDEIIIHCKSGMRAGTAAKELKNSGYEKVEVYPGMIDWVQNGGKVDKK